MDEETPQERKKRLNRERQRRYREKQKNSVENAAKKAKLAVNHRMRRANETEEQNLARLNADAQAHRIQRDNETVEQSQIRLASVAQSMRQIRSQETQQERQERVSQAERQREIDKLIAMLDFQYQVTNLNENDVDLHSCGPLNVICEFCHSRNFIGERPSDGLFTSCCRKGKVMLPKEYDINGNELNYPPFLEDFLTNPANPLHVRFRDQIRQINNAMSFASLGAKIVDVQGRGPYVFKVHGQTYHKTSHLEPTSRDTRKYAQLYVIDSTQALSIRHQHAANISIPPTILDAIDRFFRQHNRIAQTFQMIREIEERENREALAANLPAPQISMVFRRDRQSDNRRYNDPTANEIAMVFVNEDGEPPYDRDIRIYPRSPSTQEKYVQINILSAHLDPMTYAILFPYGEPGWQAKWQCNSYPGVLKNRVRTNVSMLQYKAALIAIRDNFNPILHAGKLTQQWLVDSHLQIEANNLNYIRKNQKRLRTENYLGLHDHLQNVAENENVAAGVPVILPSTFSGSPRNMREQCCDAMSIFVSQGAPDLFITFTANPNWDEIKNNLEQYETATDRPDLVARIFKLKLDELIHDVTKKNIFGNSS